MRIFLVFIVLYLCHSHSYSQSSVIDSVKTAMLTKPEVYIGLNNRNTIIQSTRTKLYGLVTGLDYAKKVKFYVGIYGFGNANQTLLTNQSDFTEDSVYRYIRANNVSLGVEYTYFQHNRLRLSLPIQLGIGNVTYDYRKTDKTTKIISEKYRVVPLEIGSNAYVDIMPWVGLKAGLGYRISIGNKKIAKLTSPYFNLGLTVFVGKIYKDIKAVNR